MPRRRIIFEDSSDEEMPNAVVDVLYIDELPRTSPEFSSNDELYHAAIAFSKTNEGAKLDPVIFKGLPKRDHPKFYEMLFTNECKSER